MIDHKRPKRDNSSHCQKMLQVETTKSSSPEDFLLNTYHPLIALHLQALTLAVASLSTKKNHSTIGNQTTTKKEGKVNNKVHT